MGKLVKCKGHGPLQNWGWPDLLVGWEDVWISWSCKPGRKTAYRGPTLIGMVDLKSEIYFHGELVKEYPEEPSYQEDLDSLLSAKEQLLAGKPFVVEGGNKNCDSIYTAKDWINRAEAEKMLAYYLRETEGMKDVRFKWVRAKRLVMPMSVGHPKEEEAA